MLATVVPVILLAYFRSSTQAAGLTLTKTVPWRLVDSSGCSSIKDGTNYLFNDINNGCDAVTATYADCCTYCSRFPLAVGFSWHKESNDHCPKSCWCKTLLDEAQAVDGPVVSAAITRGVHWLVPPQAFGVYNCFLPGLIENSQTKEQVEGSLHVFARAVRDERNYMLRGFAYFWNVRDIVRRASAKYKNPPEMVHWRPEVFAQCNNRPGMDSVTFPLQWHYPGAESYNGFFEGIIPVDQSDNCRFHVGGWNTSWGLSSVLKAARKKARSKHTPLRVYSVFGQGYGNLPVDDTERRMMVHVDYHRRMGFAGLWSYSREAGLDVHEKVAQRFPDYVTVIHWGMFPVVGVNNYDQGVMHNHALLSAAWSNIYLYLTDLDEFLATNVPRTVNQVVETCVKGQGISMGLVMCHDILYTPTADTLKAADITSWPDAPSADVLRNYTLFARTKITHFKALANPDDAVRYFVHEGEVRAGRVKKLLDDNCVYCVHMRNIVKVRRDDRESFATNTAWQWLLDDKHRIQGTFDEFKNGLPRSF